CWYSESEAAPWSGKRGRERQPMEPDALLSRPAFAQRLQSELARVRRSGGFLSLALLGSKSDASVPSNEPAFEEIAKVTRATVRLQDNVGFLVPRTVILMP